MRASHPRLAVWSLAVALCACGDDKPRPVTPPPDDTPTWEWESCPLYANNPFGRLAECARVPVPIDWADSEGEQIEIFVQRLRGDGTGGGGQLWLLEGGPGGSGADFDALMEGLNALEPGWDLYTLDHRGTGRSARLGCPQEGLADAADFDITMEEWPACLAALEGTWGDDLAHFTTTEAARDLGFLVDAMRETGRPTYVYGVSYGTIWAHRYLQIFPTQPDAVILDSLAVNNFITNWTRYFNQVGEDFMAVCATDATCGAKLGGDPWGALGALLTALDGGHCPDAGLDRVGLRTLLAQMLMSWDFRPLIGPVIYRLSRCDAADVTAVKKLSALVTTPPFTYHEKYFSSVLNLHIVHSDLYPDNPPTPAQMQAEADASYISTVGLGIDTFETFVRDQWPLYPRDEYWQGWADTSVPILMLNGDLDPQTPIWVATPAVDHLNKANQHFVTVPGAPHCIVCQTPVRTPGEPTCGTTLLRGFLADPTQAPDRTCLDDLALIDFVGGPGWPEYLLGEPDYWEHTKRARTPTPTTPPIELLQIPNLNRAPL
jgi:pimeloyl-ACP methyl ester carboxylesterase